MPRAIKIPSTPALRLLRQKGISFEVHTYDYVDRGGTKASSEALGVDEHQVVKTLVFEDDSKAPLVVLQHGDFEVSAKELARVLGKKRVGPCDPQTAQRHSGYQVGGTSPFGTKREMPIVMQASIAELPWILINGGARGVLVKIAPKVVIELLSPTLAEIAA